MYEIGRNWSKNGMCFRLCTMADITPKLPRLMSSVRISCREAIKRNMSKKNPFVLPRHVA